MSDAAVRRLAQAAGLLVDWEDASGNPQTVSPESLRDILGALGLPCGSASQCSESMAQLADGERQHFVTADWGKPIRVRGISGRAKLVLEGGAQQSLLIEAPGGTAELPPISEPGYHRLEHAGGEITLAVAPRGSIAVSELAGKRPWGVAAQIYALRGNRPAAFGEFGALADFARAAAAQGADALAISPVHALFAADPGRYSPYSPSSRQFLNPLYANPALLGGRDPDDGADAALIEWQTAAPAKLRQLRDIHAGLAATPLVAAFEAFVRESGDELRRHALFEALHGHFFEAVGANGWQDWPAAFQDPDSASVTEFAEAHADEVRFHLFLQWLADRSLGAAQAAAKEAGMAVGLVADIAVGLDPGGSHAWSRRGELLTGLGIGAPPDAFQAAGQNWGITSFSPGGLQRTGFAPFIATIRAAIRHSGGIRIDHALGLRRLWVVPQGASPLDGAYLHYPEEDLLRLVALESVRGSALVIGEDLGVVPPGFRDVIAERGVLGMRVLPFEREEDGSFSPPQEWDRDAIAMTSTHDLPTVAGWWQGRDIEWRERLGACGDRAKEQEERAEDRAALWQACREAGAAAGAMPDPFDPLPALDAAVALTAKAACELAIFPAEDLFGLSEAPNLPGTVDEHPNWRRRLPGTADALFADPAVAARIARIKAGREG